MVTIGENELSVNEISSILFGHTQVNISKNALSNVEKSYRFLADFSKGKLIYGINTGFGPMAQYKIADKDLRQLQFNLIRSHSSGTGQMLEPLYIKASMIARLSSFMKGYSGIHPDLVLLLKEMINKSIYPCVYEHGGVGASGDLVQLAHIALSMIGEGEAIYKGKILPTAEAFEKEGLKPLTIHKREGLAILNGTSVMTGIGLINIIYARKLINWSIIFSSLINELVEAYEDHFSSELNSVKNHSGQQAVASAMRELVKDSKLIKKRSEHLYHHHKIAKERIEDKVQEYYSLRCVPQILGPVLDTIENAEKVLVDELNSVNDNPIVDVKNKNIFHGGNFHGDYVSLEMDKLKISVTRLAMLAERQLNYLLNNHLNEKLPPFINMGKLGLNFGVQGLQFTATSTVAECQSLSMPVYVHSIPNNNDNQDVVSMGTNAANITRKVIDNSFEVMSIHAIAVIQAVDYLNCAKKLSPVTHKIYNELRELCPVILEDKPLYKNIRAITGYLKDKKNNLL
jgi:histidine ammonia-lyase